ncbi:alpha/beta hydrolase family protein [Gilvimarinus agarilyticus]|uniref:alpha/beta hydrolase n=1 Tax=Gilvimarinus agarilyticus TaxID=679259 RepID=UPI0005A23C54|nr:alpha/beta hydrolase [Gilvimarinus agarilyticus]
MKLLRVFFIMSGVVCSVGAAADVLLQMADDQAVVDSYVEVSPQAEFDLVYDVSVPLNAPPGMTFTAHYFFINGNYVAKRNTLPTAAGQSWRLTHPASLGLYVGEKELLKICIGDISTVADHPLQYCHEVVIRGRVDSATLHSRYVTSQSLADGQNYSGCDTAYRCAFYKDVFFGSDQPWVNDYRTSPDFPGPMGEPASRHINNLSFDFYYPNPSGGGAIDNSAAKTLIVVGHSASKSKESIRVGSASVIKFLLANNYAVVSPDFRHPLKELDDDDNPLATKDMATLVQFLKRYATVFNIERNRIVLAGNSLGGGVAVNSAFGDVAQLNSSDPMLHESSQVAGVWVLDSATVFSPNWVRSTFLEMPTEDTLPWNNAYLCYYPGIDDGGDYYKYGFAVGEVDVNAPFIGMYYLAEPADLSMGKLGVDDILFCPTSTSGGSHDIIHLPNFGEQMYQAYSALGISDRVTLGYSKTSTNYYYDLIDFVNRLPP